MRKTMPFILFILTFGILSTSLLLADDGVQVITSLPNQIVEIKGNLNQGKIMEDLSWASRSSVACFPGTQNSKFRGNHVLYRTTIPPYSEMKITVVPKDSSANFSLYGYQVGTTNFSVVPNLSSCVACEADHKWDRPRKGKTQDHTRTIEFNALKNPYNIFIGVAGAKGVESGDYTLKIELKTRVDNKEAQLPVKVYRAKSQKGKTKVFKGDLKKGVKIHDLSWAARSNVACFPATQNSKFRGNHVLYVTDLPARSEMTITVIPDDPNANLSLYAYQIGTNNKALVPNLSSCVACEADHKWDRPKKGKTQDHTRSVYLNAIKYPYRVVIGVAGAEGLSEGTFKLKIKVK